MPTPHYGQPRYRVIADELRERIESGAIPPGHLLPAESTLTIEFRASRGTVRQAIAALREAGLVATEHGRGTYANLPHRESGPDSSSETQTRERQVAANSELAALFAVQPGTVLIEQETVTRTNGAAAKVVKTYRLLPTRQ
ncbi:GntR family transcriptional regulator [Micromonospora orduensis]|uniref:GntR family transcriptional regulator n=1 Tax=Micromonospora orduensis TaxID=1420891 RepID=UPI00142EA598|nr:GntR family transcriptional regulator [Micromonospora orduensis]